MKYLCLIHAETVMESMTEDEAARRYGEYDAFTSDTKRTGHFVSANRLKPVDTAVTVSVRNGQVSVIDGPFAEIREQFCGYYLIEARDLNDAIQVAAKIPGARYGSVEIRPIADDAQTQTSAFDTERTW